MQDSGIDCSWEAGFAKIGHGMWYTNKIRKWDARSGPSPHPLPDSVNLLLSTSVWLLLMSLSKDGVEKEGRPKFNPQPGQAMNLAPVGSQRSLNCANLAHTYRQTYTQYRHTHTQSHRVNCVYHIRKKCYRCHVLPYKLHKHRHTTKRLHTVYVVRWVHFMRSSW